MMPNSEDWADNTTVTGMSDVGLPDRSFASRLESDLGWRFQCQRYASQFLVAFLSIAAFISPILMLILPQLDFMSLRNSQLRGEVESDGLVISFSFKILILAVGSILFSTELHKQFFLGFICSVHL